MSKSKTNPKSTKAGVVLSADARKKLQRLADWLEMEQIAPQHQQIRLAYLGGLITIANTTYMTPFAVLVQMYDPFKKTDAQKITYDTYRINPIALRERFCRILGINEEGYMKLLRYVYTDLDTPIINQLRSLK